jgi:hypothetical protein
VGSVVWALKINHTPLILLQAKEGDFPAALNKFFAYVAVALTSLGPQDLQTQETLQIAKSTHDLLDNWEVPIQKLAVSKHLDRRALFKRSEQAGYPLHIRRGRMSTPHS